MLKIMKLYGQKGRVERVLLEEDLIRNQSMTSRRWAVTVIRRHSFRSFIRTGQPALLQDDVPSSGWCVWYPSIRMFATTNSSSSSSSSGSTGNAIDLKGLSPIDIEKELFKIKRRMGGYYSKGMYSDALGCAIELERIVADEMGTKNAIYASCLNNVALMNKMLGHTDIAMDKYTGDQYHFSFPLQY